MFYKQFLKKIKNNEINEADLSAPKFFIESSSRSIMLKKRIDEIEILADDLLAIKCVNNPIKIFKYENSKNNWTKITEDKVTTNVKKLTSLGNDNLGIITKEDVVIWNYKANTYRHICGQPPYISKIAALPNNCLAMARQDNRIQIWDLAKQHKQQSVTTLTGHTNTISSLLVVNNRYLISGSHDKTIKIWDIRNRYRYIKTIIGHNGQISNLAFLSKENVLISSNCCNGYFNVTMWRINQDWHCAHPSQMSIGEERTWWVLFPNSRIGHIDWKCFTIYEIVKRPLKHNEIVKVTDILQNSTPQKTFYLKCSNEQYKPLKSKIRNEKVKIVPPYNFINYDADDERSDEISPLNKKRKKTKSPRKRYKLRMNSKRYKHRLLLGEGDFSFTLALINKHPFLRNFIIATELRSEDEIKEVYHSTAEEILKKLREKVPEQNIIFGVDACKLHENQNLLNIARRFKRIHFVCPHSGGNPKEKSVNQQIKKCIEGFFESAKRLQRLDDRIHVVLPTGDESEKWRLQNTYGIYKASMNAGYLLIKKRKFVNKKEGEDRYPSYCHRKTMDDKKIAVSNNMREYIFCKTEYNREELEPLLKRKTTWLDDGNAVNYYQEPATSDGSTDYYDSSSDSSYCSSPKKRKRNSDSNDSNNEPSRKRRKTN